jgi:hypothetical protein
MLHAGHTSANAIAEYPPLTLHCGVKQDVGDRGNTITHSREKEKAKAMGLQPESRRALMWCGPRTEFLKCVSASRGAGMRTRSPRFYRHLVQLSQSREMGTSTGEKERGETKARTRTSGESGRVDSSPTVTSPYSPRGPGT